MDINAAENVKNFLRWDGHRTWGFVIYRCTYSNDEDWTRFMEKLREENREALSYFEGGLEVWESLDLTVFEDQSKLDGASKNFVREQFREWCELAPRREQGSDASAKKSQRYRFCLQVDEASLRSFVEAPPDASIYDMGYINLIKKDIEPRWVGPEAEYSEIEGSTEADTGWYVRDQCFANSTPCFKICCCIEMQRLYIS